MLHVLHGAGEGKLPPLSNPLADGPAPWLPLVAVVPLTADPPASLHTVPPYSLSMRSGSGRMPPPGS